VDAVSTHSALTEELTDIWHRLLGSVVRRNEDVDAFRMFTGTVPRKVTRRYGFLSDTSPPLSLVTSGTKLLALPLFSAGEPITRISIFETLISIDRNIDSAGEPGLVQRWTNNQLRSFFHCVSDASAVSVSPASARW
jgi:hypothetical protein